MGVLFGVTIIIIGGSILLTTYGSIIPQSISAKSELTKQPIGVTAKQLFFPEAVSLFLLPIAIWGMLRYYARQIELTVLVKWIVLYSGAYLIARPFIWSWYSEPIQYVIILFAAIGIADLLKRIKLYQRISVLYFSLGGSVVVCSLWIILSVRNDVGSITDTVYSKLENWSANTLNKTDTVLAIDIGAIGFYSNSYIIDGAGLVSPKVVGKKVPELIQSLHPKYLYINATQEHLSMIDLKLQQLYKPIKRFSKNGDTSISLDLNKYPQSWVQDYIVFKAIERAPL
jgi:hypothetical protein